MIVMGNPEVSQSYPYPYLEIPYPPQQIWVLMGQSKGSIGLMDIQTLDRFEYPWWVSRQKLFNYK